MNTAQNYARAQADGYDNIAPTTLQGQQAWQYAQSDNFLSPEEATAVMRQKLEPYQAQIEAKLAQIGYPPEVVSQHPAFENALYTGQKTDPITVILAPDVKLNGLLRINMTDAGPELRFTPIQRQLIIPNEIEGVRLAKGEKQELMQQGTVARPFLLVEKGESIPTFLRVDEQTNTIELIRLRPEMLPTKLLGIDLTRDQQLQLAGGHGVRLSGLLDQQGEPFTATVQVSAARQEMQFTDVSRLSIGLKPDNESRQQLAINNEGAKTDLTRSQEITTGQTTVTNAQREMMERLLDNKPEQKIGSLKQRLS